MRGLYAIVDTSALLRRGLSVMGVAEAVFAARPAAVQLRDKGGAARDTLSLLRSLAPLAARFEVPLFANDRADLALLAGCDGVHVGQEDLPPEAVRRIAQHLRIGLSTHSAEQIDAAGPAPLDYVAIGPIFPTGSKDNASPTVGLEGLRVLTSRARLTRPARPVVAIGGITLETAAAVGGLCDVAAVISALVPTPSEGAATANAIHERVASLHAAICGGAA